MKNKPFQLRVSSSYGSGPPWVFSGRAFYQLHLVKADIAMRFIPSDLKLVQAFGYTLGGMYLAQYDSSPAGPFDELVVIAGTVWNPPTSCAWAARVLVNSSEACDHGKKEVGLPSHVARFSPVMKPVKQQQTLPLWNPFTRVFSSQGQGLSESHQECGVDIMELEGSSQKPLCQIAFPHNWVKSELKKQWHGPSVSLSLPSFSGKTEEQPQLLKYSCQLNCSVKVVKPAIVITPPVGEQENFRGHDFFFNSVLSLLAAKPLLALCFENMLMHVEAAIAVAPNGKRMQFQKATTERRGNILTQAKTS